MQEFISNNKAGVKSKTKGYYKKKLKQLKQQNIFTQQTNRELFPKNHKIKKPAKQVARQARKIKALYIQNLQHAKTQLQAKIKELQADITKLKLNKEKDTQKNDPFSGCFHRVERQFQNLYSACKQNNSDEIERSLCILRDKFGIYGRQRLNIVDTLFDCIIKYLMPMHYRLLLENCEESYKYYELLAGKDQKAVIKQKFHEEQKQLLINIRPQIISTKRQYDRILKKLFETKKELLINNSKCQNIVDKIQHSLSAQFVGCLLINLDATRSFNPKYQKIYPISKWNNLSVISSQEESIVIEEQNKQLQQQKQYKLFESILDEVLSL